MLITRLSALTSTANALCKEIDASCTFTNQAFDSLIPSLKFRRFDAVMAGMDITPEREKQVLFTTPYYDNSALFVGQQGKYTSVDQLKGKKVGVQNGTTHQKFIMDKHPEITTVPYDSYQNAKLDLQNGRIDAVFGDTAVVTEWLKANPKLAPVGDKVTDKDYFGTGPVSRYVRATPSCSRNSILRWKSEERWDLRDHL